MSLDQKAIQFVENLAETLLKEEHGVRVVLSAKDQKRLFKETVSSLAPGKLQRELCKYSPLYCKRFQRCVRGLRQRLGASEGTNIIISHLHNGSPAQSSEDAPSRPTDQGSSEIGGETTRCISVRSNKRPGCSKETKDSTHNMNNSFDRVCFHQEPSVSAHPPGLVYPRKQQDLTIEKDACHGNSKTVDDLCRELTILYHHCDHASLTNKMNHAVGLFSVEMANILTSKNINRASDVRSCLHSVMLYFHFKCDILHADKIQVSLSKDSAYKQHMASMLSLYYGLNIVITRTESERSSRLAQHALFKACLLLNHANELLMDVILQLPVKPEPTDAPYLYPTLMYVLKRPPYPFTPASYIKHVLVCRLARYILPQNQYPELTQYLQSSLTLLPPYDLSTWLTDHCPHLTSEMSAYANGHQMTSYLLQVASYDLCRDLQKSLYHRPGSASPHAGGEASGKVDAIACSAGLIGALDTEGDPAAIEEHHEIDLEEMLGNHHSKQTNIRESGRQDGSTDISKPEEHSLKEIQQDVNVQAETPISPDKPGQQGITSNASSVSKKAESKSKQKASTGKALPLVGPVGEGGEEVLVVAKENKSVEKQFKCIETVSCTDESSLKQCEQDIVRGQVSPSLNMNQKEHVANYRTSVTSKNRECLENRDESLLNKREQDLQRVRIPSISPSINKNEKEPVADCHTYVASKNRECLKSIKAVEESESVIPDSCDDETGSVDIIYSSETEHSDELQRKMALRKARHLRNLLPSADPSKSSIGANSSRVMTRSRCKESLPDASTMQASREKKQGKRESTAKKTEGSQAVSPVLKDCMSFEGIRVRLVHIDRKRGSVGRAKEGDTERCAVEEDSSVIVKHARQIRRSLNKLNALIKCDSENDLIRDKAVEAPESMVSFNLAESGLKASIKTDSYPRTSPRKLNRIKYSESRSSPKKMDVVSRQLRERKRFVEPSVDCQKSVMSLDSADNHLSAGTRVASSLSRSPRKSKHQHMSEVVELSVDTQEPLISHSADGIQRAGTKQLTSLRRSPRKINLKDKLELMRNELVTGQSVDPYEFTVSSDSAGDDPKATTRVASNPRRSLQRGNFKDRSRSPAEPSFPQGSSSYRETLTELATSVAPGHQSLQKIEGEAVRSKQQKQSPVRNEKGQVVSSKEDSSYVVLKAQTTSSGKHPPSPKSSLSQFRSLRKRSFSEGCDDGQSSSSSKVFTSTRGSSAELAVLLSRVSLKKIGIVPPYTQVCDSRPPQGESSSGLKTSLGGRSSGSRTTVSKTSPRSSGDQKSSIGRSLGSRTTDSKISPRSSKINSRHGLRPRSSARIHLVRKALEFT